MKKLLVVLVAIACFTSTAVAEPWRVFDNIGIFTDEDVVEIEQAIFDFQRNTNMDFAVLTMDDYFGENSLAKIVDAFYVSNNFGYGRQANGIVHLFTVHNKTFTYYAVRYGEMRNIFDDEKRDAAYCASSSFIDAGNCKGSVIQMIESATEAVMEYKKSAD